MLRKVLKLHYFWILAMFLEYLESDCSFPKVSLNSFKIQVVFYIHIYLKMYS